MAQAPISLCHRQRKAFRCCIGPKIDRALLRLFLDWLRTSSHVVRGSMEAGAAVPFVVFCSFLPVIAL
jgi:hypothetical protein